MSMVTDIRKEIIDAGDPEKAVFLQRFFKTGKGEYGYGDIFLGLTVPQSRAIARKYKDLPLGEVEALLKSKYHEERLIALFLLVHNFKSGDEDVRKEIFDFYLSHTAYINNWDLVDSSAGYIVGEYLSISPRVSPGRNINILKQLASSKSLWERRIAIIATFAYIYKGRYEETFAVAELLLDDKEDLIHKAVGWMLREVGKRVSREEEEKFLLKHYKVMPRTMLRYAIEHFPEEERKRYLLGNI
jgi:3-methyladenine DNA glycosylase AlkD